MLYLVEESANLINRQPIAGKQTVHDRITEKVIKRRFGSSGIHDNLQNRMIGLRIPFETFPPVAHEGMRIKPDAALSGGRSCPVTVRDLPADHDKPLTPERPLRRNPVGHKRSARPDWGLSSVRSLRLPSPIQRPYNDKVDQPIAPVIEPLNASGRPSHPRPVIRRGSSQPLGGEGPDAVQPRSLLWTDCDRRPITPVRLQVTISQTRIPCGRAAIIVAVNPDQVSRGREYDFQGIERMRFAVRQSQARRGRN